MGDQVKPTWRARGTWASMAMAAFLATAPATTVGQGGVVAQESAVKAAFLLNFLKFTEWPSLAPEAQVVSCVVGDDGVADALADLALRQRVGGRLVDVSRPADPKTWWTCHLLYITTAEARRSSGALAAIKSVPVLTVSDARDFADSTGVIGLYLESGRMRFAINAGAAGRARLRLSSRLLKLARIVEGGHVQ